MPEPTPPSDAGGTAGRPAPGPLTPAAIDAALADFRRWLEDLAAGGSEPPPEPEEETVDLATLVAAFTALRHEVNLQTKATRAQAEQMAQVLEALETPTAAPDSDEALRPLVKAVAEIYDTLTRTTGEIDRLRDGFSAAADRPPEPPSVWRRLFGISFPPPQGGREQEVDIAARLEAAATGLRMSERRVERLMRGVGLEPVACVGLPFDPEAMEAVEAVADSGQPSGTVVEELRRGYRWCGRVFRYAQVRVAK
jgi:molecular chaperone GrpE